MTISGTVWSSGRTLDCLKVASSDLGPDTWLYDGTMPTFSDLWIVQSVRETLLCNNQTFECYLSCYFLFAIDISPQILLSYADAAHLTKLRRDEERKIILAQAQVRGYLARSRSKKLKQQQQQEQQQEQDLHCSTPKSLDQLGIMKKKFDKLFDQSPTSTISTRSGNSPSNTLLKKRNEDYQNKAFEALKKNQKSYDDQLRKTLRKLEKPDLKV